MQWGGYVRIPANGFKIATASDDGSRMWIDRNQNGLFENTPEEFVSNGWGNGQFFQLGPYSVELGAGIYPIRIQYKDTSGPNQMALAWKGPGATGRQLDYSGDSAAGVLDEVGSRHIYKVRLDANQLYRFQHASSSNRIWDCPGDTLASDGRRISVYNEFGQWLESSYGDYTYKGSLVMSESR